MPTIDVCFKGLCTHLISNNTWTRGARPLRIRTREGRAVPIRTFIANSEPDFIKTLIDLKRCIPKHVAKIEFNTKPDDAIQHVLNLKEYKKDRWQGDLKRVVLGFQGDPCKPGVIKQSFTRLPSVFSLTPDLRWHDPHPHPDVMLGNYPPNANVYVDFLSGFSIARVPDIDPKTDDAVQVTLTTPEDPLFMSYQEMSENAIPMMISLPDDLAITISNLPEDKTDRCTANDYLLHYLATTLDLRNDPPMWPLDTDESGRTISPEVYCSSSGYP